MLMSALRLRRGFSLVTTLALSWSSIALAAPAVVKRDTQARSAPFAVAPLVEKLHAGLKVSADDKPSNGWRRLQLPSGRFVFVDDDDVQVELSPPAGPASVPGPPTSGGAAADGATSAETSRSLAAAPVEPLTSRPATRAPLYVGDFAHLAELVQTDEKVLDLARTLDIRQTAAGISAVGGVLVGAALLILADNLLRSRTCVPGACVRSTNLAAHNGGMALLFVAPVLGWALYPTAADRATVLDEWNNRHPDRPFIDHAGVEAPQ